MAEEEDKKNATEEVGEITEAQATEEVQKYANKVSENDVADIVAKEDKIKGFFRHIDVLKKFFDEVCDIFSMLKDRTTGQYTDVSWKTVAGIAGALIYVLSPLDLFPDFLPVVGYMDDAAVIGYIVHTFAKDDLARYRAWKKQRANTIEA